MIFGERKTEHNHSSCSLDLRLRWITEVGSGIYTTPTIADLFADGTKEVVASTSIQLVTPFMSALYLSFFFPNPTLNCCHDDESKGSSL